MRAYGASVLVAGMLAAIVAAYPDPSSSSTVEVKLEPVSFAKLQDLIKSKKGHIVVVDYWATWCIPCRKEFPNLVELNRRRAKDGVVCISAAVDSPEKANAALKFLKEKGAAFTNYRLEDEKETVNEKLKVEGIPLVIVYDREGNATRFTKAPIYEQVNKKVDELLAKKK